MKSEAEKRQLEFWDLPENAVILPQEKSPQKLGGKKNDQGKPDLSLLPRAAKEGIARAFMHGANKYGRFNYLKGMDWCRLIAGIDRHLTAFNDGEDFDLESKLNHLHHAGAGIMMLIEYYEKNLGNDDRKQE